MDNQEKPISLEKLNIFSIFSSINNDINFDKVNSFIEINNNISINKVITIIVSSLLICIGLNTNSYIALIAGLIIFSSIEYIIFLGFGIIRLNIDIIFNSLKNIILFVLINIFISIIYFYISPYYAYNADIQIFSNKSAAEIIIAFIGGFAAFISIIWGNTNLIFKAVSIATSLPIQLCLIGYSIVYSQIEISFTNLKLFLVLVFLILLGSIILSYIMFRYKENNKGIISKAIAMMITGILVFFGFYYTFLIFRISIVQHNLDFFIKEELMSKSIVFHSKNIDIESKKIEIYYSGMLSKSSQDIELRKKHKINSFTINFNEI